MSLFLNDELQGTSPKTANGISFDKTGTSLKSTDVQSAIAETDAKIGNATISSIGDGTVTGAISTVNSNLESEIVSEHYNFGSKSFVQGMALIDINNTDWQLEGYEPIMANAVANANKSVCTCAFYDTHLYISYYSKEAHTSTVEVRIIFKKKHS